jgi:hypothetical protein
MKSKTKTIVFNNCKFQIKIFNDRSAYPENSEVLHYVGLSQMNEQQLTQMNEFFWEQEFTKAIRYVAYILDISDKKAYVRIMKYYIVYLGLTLTNSKFVHVRNLINWDFGVFLELLKLFADPTYEVIIELFRKEGFTAKEVEYSLIEFGYIPKAKMILSECEYILA